MRKCFFLCSSQMVGKCIEECSGRQGFPRCGFFDIPSAAKQTQSGGEYEEFIKNQSSAGCFKIFKGIRLMNGPIGKCRITQPVLGTNLLRKDLRKVGETGVQRLLDTGGNNRTSARAVRELGGNPFQVFEVSDP